MSYRNRFTEKLVDNAFKAWFDPNNEKVKVFDVCDDHKQHVSNYQGAIQKDGMVRLYLDYTGRLYIETYDLPDNELYFKVRKCIAGLCKKDGYDIDEVCWDIMKMRKTKAFPARDFMREDYTIDKVAFEESFGYGLLKAWIKPDGTVNKFDARKSHDTYVADYMYALECGYIRVLVNDEGDLYFTCYDYDNKKFKLLYKCIKDDADFNKRNIFVTDVKVNKTKQYKPMFK